MSEEELKENNTKKIIGSPNVVKNDLKPHWKNAIV
jgi:hypothetical protein